MKLVAVVRPVVNPDDAARAVAAATGLTLAETRMRLAPEPPALVARLADGEADLLVDALRKAGLAALAVDVRCPSDRDRLPVRSFTVGDAALGLTPRAGAPVAFAWPEVSLVLRGTRVSRSEVEHTDRSRHFSAGTALATGGLKLTRASGKVVRTSEDTTEQVLLVYTRDGRAATLAESQLEFSCLGAAMSPSSTANMGVLAQLLRAKAPAAFHDDRLVRLGRRMLPFVAGGESRAQSGTTTTTQTDTSGALDVLAEVMRQGVAAGLMP